jgi:two-component system CheB/CheR fusion protein
MYFTADTQSQILARFHFALDPQGFLMLGRSEMLITHSDMFRPVDLKQRMFCKVTRTLLRERVRGLAAEPQTLTAPGIPGDLREAVFDIGAPAQLVVDAQGQVVLLNHAARRMFGLGDNDVGRPIQDLEISYRPVDLRTQLDVIKEKPRTIDVTDVRWTTGGRERVMEVRLTPLMADSVQLGTAVTYRDVTEEHAVREELAQSKRALEQAYEELNSTVEELETTNEELQSTNEELETTNEELQSTNEELETMNEELQSSNEELETMNDELRNRSLELNDVNSFLETILTTIGFAVVVVDRAQQIRIWNAQAREMWGLAADEVQDQHLMSLDIGLPLDKLRPDLRAILQGREDRHEVVLEATNRRGRKFLCRVVVLPLGASSVDGVPGAIITMEPADQA